ncbi:MAG TPA: DUF378 domain-containing protein [Candidatus Saccharimonadales bacterium]|nr:DUF378 domain-containing protein [Candidatus Saccharimonadales bacterium]
MNALDKTAYVLVVIGGLNWGLIGFFEWSFVDEIFSTGLARVIYAVVGVAALYMAWQMLVMMGKEEKSKS